MTDGAASANKDLSSLFELVPLVPYRSSLGGTTQRKRFAARSLRLAGEGFSDG